MSTQDLTLVSMGISIQRFRFDDRTSYEEYLTRSKADLSASIEAVIPIIHKVKNEGDSAVLEFTKKFDQISLKKMVWNVDNLPEEKVPESLKESFQIAKNNITEFHKYQLPLSWEKEISGNRLGIKYTPVESVTIYAPGGKALYPSSILMGAIPAKLAGVKNIQIATPPQKDGIPPILSYVAKLVGIDRIVTVGGSQAIAACAYGTESIPKSEFIVGPGNSYVAAAKVHLSGLGVIGIESPAGPSEVVIIADDKANPKWIACDLLSQAEHGEDSIAILLTDSMQLAKSVQKEIDLAFVERTKRLMIKQNAIQKNSVILVADSIQDCIDFSNIYAPEHLEIQTEDYNSVFSKINHAGSVFLGEYSPVAMGDYISGTNHILPTAGGARLFSSLGVDHFLKRITFQEIRKASLEKLYPYVKEMSESEGLDQEHGHSVYLRTL
jgi:histidinol dehydrogenase